MSLFEQLVSAKTVKDVLDNHLRKFWRKSWEEISSVALLSPACIIIYYLFENLGSTKIMNKPAGRSPLLVYG